MPCYDDRAFGVEELIERNDKLVRLLCRQCNKLEKNGLEHMMIPEVITWWKEHKKLDEERRI